MSKVTAAEKKTAALAKKAALVLYAHRKARSNSPYAKPQGSSDNGGRWYPSDAEDADGYTRSIRSPSRAWPRKHCIALAEIDPFAMMQRAAKLDTDFAAEFDAFQAEEEKRVAKNAERRERAADQRERELSAFMRAAFPG